MEIIVDLDDPNPLFAQLISQIKQAVQRGDLRAGDPLPSIRQLATDLEMNSKTVAKAYRLLERDSIIQARGYRGTFVHPEAKRHCTVDLKDWALTVLGEAITRCREAGVTDSEVRIAIAQILSERSN